MVQCNPWENPVYFDGCCTHTEKIKFLLWHRVFVYTMEEVRMILYDYQLISKTFVYGILKTYPLIPGLVPVEVLPLEVSCLAGLHPDVRRDPK